MFNLTQQNLSFQVTKKFGKHILKAYLKKLLFDYIYLIYLLVTSMFRLLIKISDKHGSVRGSIDLSPSDYNWTTIIQWKFPSLTHKQFWDICSFEHLMVANQIRKGKVKGGEQKWEPQMKQPESPCRTHGQGKNQIVACILQLWIFLPELSAHTMAEPSDQIRDNTEMQQLCIAAIITRLNN